jgi:hypothetical protein
MRPQTNLAHNKNLSSHLNIRRSTKTFFLAMEVKYHIMDTCGGKKLQFHVLLTEQ